MNRSGKGFGLTGVAVAVAVMIVMAVFSTSSQAQDFQLKSNQIHVDTSYTRLKASN